MAECGGKGKRWADVVTWIMVIGQDLEKDFSNWQTFAGHSQDICGCPANEVGLGKIRIRTCRWKRR